MSQAQSFKNHARFYPLFHYFVAPILLLNVVWWVVRVIRAVSFETVASLLVALALLGLAFAARVMALRVQDRVIRLEMRLRMQELLPPELRARIPEFTVDQLVALRFACDGELPGLAQMVLNEKLTQRKTIKKLVRDWQPDLIRA
ncbi:MAG: DUF6526 family protein [Terriglobales bacterium]